MKINVSLCCGDCNCITADEVCLLLNKSVTGFATSDKGHHTECPLPDVPIWQRCAVEFTSTDDQQLKISTMRVLEEIQDRACKVGVPIGLSKFTEYIRSLYPEYYSKSDETINKE